MVLSSVGGGRGVWVEGGGRLFGLPVEEGVGKVVEGVGGADRPRFEDVYLMAAIVLHGGAEIKGPQPMVSPCEAGVGSLMNDH